MFSRILKEMFHPYCIVVTGLMYWHSHLESIFKFQVQYLFLDHLSAQNWKKTLFQFLAFSTLDWFIRIVVVSFMSFVRKCSLTVKQPNMEQKGVGTGLAELCPNCLPPKIIFLGNTSWDSWWNICCMSEWLLWQARSCGKGKSLSYFTNFGEEKN